MKAFLPYKIPFKGLKNGIHLFDYQIDSTFFSCFENSVIKKGAIDLKLEMEKFTSHLVLNFTYKGKINAECDRCLDFFDLPIQDEFSLIVKYSDEPKEEEEDIVYLPTTAIEINIAHYIYEFIHLSTPIRKACEEDEKGLPSCGNPNIIRFLTQEEDKTTEADENIQSNPFLDALKDFKEK